MWCKWKDIVNNTILNLFQITYKIVFCSAFQHPKHNKTILFLFWNTYRELVLGS